MCELLWSDPQPGKGRSPNKRGVGVAFGPDVTRAFLELNKLDLLVRSHEVWSPAARCAVLLPNPCRSPPFAIHKSYRDPVQ